MNTDIAMKIKDLAEKRGASNADVARAAGVSRSAVTKWFKGLTQPKAEILPSLSAIFNVPVAYFLSEEAIVDAQATGGLDALKEMVSMPEQAFDVAAGQGRINEGYNICDMHYPDGSEYSTIRICGDSMFPVLHNGDLVRVHHVTDDISPSDLAVVKINGDEATIKHVEYASDGIWLKAENREVFPDKFFSMQECLTLPVQIIGVATELISRKL